MLLDLFTGEHKLCRPYRHSSIETTYRLYVAKNTILKTRRYEARMRSNGNGNGEGRHSNGNGLDPAVAVVPAVPPTPSSATAMPCDKVITEDEAIRQVRGLGLNYRPLRAYGLKVGKVRKNGRVYDYPAQFISGLAGNYFTSQEAMNLLKMPKSTFFAWRNADGVECIQIGKIGLHRKDVILLKKRSG